jgi:flagellar assembly protein FliH
VASLQKGRFISKGEQERYSDIEVVSYSFGDFATNEMIIPDNPRKSLVLKKLHTESELANKVHESPQFRTRLQPRGSALEPQDMTADHARTLEELRIKNRRKMMDEEEAVAQELADMMERNRGSLGHVSWKVSAKDDAQSSAEQRATDTAAAEMADAAAARPETLHAAASIANAAGVVEKQSEFEGEKPVLQQAFEHIQAARNEVETERIRESLRAEIHDEAFASGFEQGRLEGVENGRTEGVSVGREEGRHLGYEDGFRSGELRGEMAGEAKVEKSLALIAEIAHHIDLLRSEILASGQEIFVEFAKAATESILRTQIVVDDNTLRSFLVQTMSPFSEKAFLHIEVNGFDVNRITQVLAQYPDLQKKVKVRENRELAVGDFRVEADNEVVIVDIKKAVNDFMESIKGEILSSNSHKEGAA